jgi:hypothetical protein
VNILLLLSYFIYNGIDYIRFIMVKELKVNSFNYNNNNNKLLFLIDYRYQVFRMFNSLLLLLIK